MTKANHLCGRIQHHAAAQSSLDFFNLLTGSEFLSVLEAELPVHRERLFPPTETLAMFLAQVLNADASCQAAVNHSAMTRVRYDLPLCSTDSGGYCRARQRLPVEMISTLNQAVGQWIEDRQLSNGSWRGRPVRLVDGTTLTLPDTPANQASYPQESNQKPGLGFPICRVVALAGLASGGILNAAMGRYQGKGGHEQALLRELLDSLEIDDILLGDALYPTYFLLTELQARGVDGVFQQHGSRAKVTDFSLGQQLGHRDHLLTLKKPRQCPDWMDKSKYDNTPDEIIVRELKVSGKLLVTTLLDAKAIPKSEVKALYWQRWNIEIDFRNLKTTLGMEQLRCKSPEMAEKEFQVYLLAYNLVRLVMQQSAMLADILPRQLSFKHSLQLWLAWTRQPPDDDIQLRWQLLLTLVAQSRVGLRPGRIEPRALKRRPKPYPMLMLSRAEAQKQARLHGHPKRQKGKKKAETNEQIAANNQLVTA